MKLKNSWPIIALTIVALFVCLQNYTPGTILSGWDTLHPEFNFGLALKREIFGVFRTYQGLGAVAAHSDMADLPRIITLAVFNLILPMDFLRYSYIFLNIILGPIGMYFLLRRAVFSKTPKESAIPSFLGGLFYLLNLGTVQQFIVPFEMFTTQYAFLPWLFLSATEYLNTKTHQKKMLILFAITTLFSIPMAYTPTLWYMYFVAFISYLSALTLIRIRNKEFPIIKKTFILILLTLLINSFWILPNIYYIFTHGSGVTQANINKLFSSQAFLYNKEFGNIADISLLKSYLFDWNIYSDNDRFVQLLAPWIAHLRQPIVQVFGYIFAGVAFGGIIFSIFKRNKFAISFLPALILSIFFIFNDNFPTSPLYTFLTDKIPFFKEAFRFPQSKLFGIFTFVFAIYFAFGQLFIARFIRKIFYSSSDSDVYRKSREVNNLAMEQFNNESIKSSSRHARTINKTELTQILIFTILILYFMLPAFNGHFISPYMRIKIPQAYFEMFKWFDKEPPGGRIANLPIHSLWGWEYYEWDFQGAGFVWFGIKQPFLSRDFDRWSPYNEQYYREMSYAIYSQNPEALKQVVEKYHIKYILFDKSIIAPGNDPKVLLYEESQAILDKQDYLEIPKKFSDTLLVYKIRSNKPDDEYVIQNPAFIDKESQSTSNVAQVYYEDAAYKDYGNYIVNDSNAGAINYPLVNLIDSGGKILPNKLNLTDEGVTIKLSKDSKTEFSLPSYLDTQESIFAELFVEKNQNQLVISLQPLYPLDGLKNRPIPISTKVNLPQNKEIILSINQKDNFILNLSTINKPLSLGTLSLKTKIENTITIYPRIPNESLLPDFSKVTYALSSCEDIGEHNAAPSFGIDRIQNNAFYLFGKNTNLCMTIPLSEVILKDLKYPETLLNVTFDYQSNLPVRFCIAALVNGVCQNSNDNSLSQYFNLQKEDLKSLAIQFQLDTTSNDSINKALYTNITLNLTYPLHHEILPIDTLKKSLQNLNQIPPKGSTFSLPYSSNKLLNVDITTLPKTSGICPNTPPSDSQLIKKQILINNKNRFIRYETSDGSSCDHFSYQNLSQNEAYLVTITSRNVKGLPSTICITNTVSKHCDIYSTLSPNKDFQTDVFLLPPFIKNEKGFDINIGNLGIKKTPSINDLKSIKIIPIPYKWLSQIKTATMKQPASPQGGFNNEAINVLILPQSFEKGWKAYGIKNYELGIMNWSANLFPFIFGKELKDHVLVNGWANGWKINNLTMQQFNNRNNLNNETIVIRFLPQYLEYLGFILLLGTIARLIIMKKS